MEILLPAVQPQTEWCWPEPVGSQAQSCSEACRWSGPCQSWCRRKCTTFGCPACGQSELKERVNEICQEVMGDIGCDGGFSALHSEQQIRYCCQAQDMASVGSNANINFDTTLPRMAFSYRTPQFRTLDQKRKNAILLCNARPSALSVFPCDNPIGSWNVGCGGSARKGLKTMSLWYKARMGWTWSKVACGAQDLWLKSGRQTV